jgi:hypothetical protein
MLYNLINLVCPLPPNAFVIHKDKITKSHYIIPTKGTMVAKSSLEVLHALVKEAKTWPTKGVFAEVFIKTESGEEEKEIVDICQHIGPSSNDVSSRQLHKNDFKSHHVRKPTGLKKYYFSPEYNSNTAEG